MEILEEIGRKKSKLPVILLTGQDDYDVDFVAMKCGASDYLSKNRVDEHLLERSIRYAIEHKQMEEVLRRHHYHLEQLVEDRTRELVRANEMLKQIQSQLEVRVKERTAQLEHAKERLELEIEERMHAEEEQRRMEQQLRQAQKMEAIGTLAGGIAHDFNNILGIILGYAEIALHNTEEGTPLWEQLSEIFNAGCRARDLARQILTFSRRTGEARQPLHVGIIVKECLKLLRAAIPSTIEVEHKFHIEDQNWDMVLADPSQIHQIMMNLCTNAAHAMRDTGGTLGIGLSRIYLAPGDWTGPAGLQTGCYLKLTVTDTGHGMEADTVERIFEPYFTTKKQGEGTGLGLAMVHGIVKSHEGAIMVRSQPGSGTTFDIYLPGFEAEPLAVQEEPAPFPRGEERILFVDDEEVLLNASKEMLEQLGYSVEPFTNGIDALRAFRAEPDAFDLIITDQTMPRITGLELARAILEVRADARIVLCTGLVEAITPERVNDCGIRELVSKPLLLRTLAETVRRVLDEPQREA